MSQLTIEVEPDIRLGIVQGDDYVGVSFEAFDLTPEPGTALIGRDLRTGRHWPARVAALDYKERVVYLALDWDVCYLEFE